MNEIRNKLSADPGSMILGIIALLISIVGCCCGILAIPAVIMSIIGLVWANKSMKAYEISPENYNPSSVSSVKSARVVNIIAIVLSVLGLIISIMFFGFISNPENIFNRLEKGEFNQIDDTNDITKEEVDTWEYEDSMDSTEIDSRPLEVEELTDSIDNN